DHAGGNHSARLQWPATARAVRESECERTERTMAHRGNAAADELVVDETAGRHFIQRAPAGNRCANHDAPVVAEVRDDSAGAEIVERAERAAGDFDADANLADELLR